LVKDVIIDQNTNQAKFIIVAQGMHEAQVESSIRQDGSFVVDVLSGDLKDSKIIIILQERTGFDGTPNGATTVKAKLILHTSWLASTALSFVNDSDIQTAVGDGFYEVGKYAKSGSSQNQILNAAYTEANIQNAVSQKPDFEMEKKKPITASNATLELNQIEQKTVPTKSTFNKPQSYILTKHVDNVLTFFKQFAFW
jgi:hypothetical protein